MPLYIRDPVVEELAERVREAIGAKSKMDAVRIALERELKRAAARMSFDERNAEVMAMADALGATNATFDMKTFTDHGWGRI